MFRWVMKTSTTSPVFTGDTATVNQPCISAPNPIKATQPYTNITSSKPTTSNIAWPLQDSERPFDAFLSNCDSTSYCSPDNSQCIPRISQDGYCNSTNECSNEQQCISGRCNGGETTWAPQGPQTSHLLAGIISAIVAVIAGIIAAVFYIRRRRRQAQQGSMAKKETVQDTLASFEQCYESDHTTPAMQQRHLQMRLQQEHSIGDKGDMSSSPPPYSP
ncbi:hypothetical protein NQZ79_g1159 [Umbelopsis isabellina]|nr:hypothetical protein NQZ79_g1159 [Umbelopsis isabellina]